MVCEGLVFELDRLIGGCADFLVGEPGDEPPEHEGVCFMGAALHPLHPDSPFMGSNLLGKALFQVWEARVEVVPASGSISVCYEGFGCVR